MACLLGVVLCAGVSCEITFPDTRYVQLDQAVGDLTITSAQAAATAGVVADITHDGAAIELQEGQAVLVNGQALQGPGFDGQYSRSITRADAYTVRVNEPTLGAFETTISPPAETTITSPTAGQSVSLAGGFELRWDNPAPGVRYTLTMTQLLGTVRQQVLGPFDEGAGSLTVTSSDLSRFRQGANLDLKLTRSVQQAGISGFASGTLRVELAQTVSVVPAP
jgi:hypothetical protein